LSAFIKQVRYVMLFPVGYNEFFTRCLVRSRMDK